MVVVQDWQEMRCWHLAVQLAWFSIPVVLSKRVVTNARDRLKQSSYSHKLMKITYGVSTKMSTF